MFQSAMFCGGFDSDEMQFCFSFYPEEGVEYWFQFSLSDAREIAMGRHVSLIGSTAPAGY